MVPKLTVQVRAEDLRAIVARRTIDMVARPGARTYLALDLELNQPLPLSVASRLEAEVTAAGSSPPPGIVTATAVQIFGDRIRFELDPLQPRAIRLETFGAALGYSGASLRPGAAGSILLTVASLLSHLAEGARLRPHGELHQGVILLSPGASVALVGSGYPVLQAFLAAPAPKTLEIPKAPEVRAGEPPSPVSDVYALGALYAQVLAGRRASTPGPTAVPDPRPGLVRLLRTCLDPNPHARPRDAIAFGSLLQEELYTSGIALAAAPELDQLLRTYVAKAVPAGNTALLDAAFAPEVLEGYLFGDIPALPAQSTGARAPAPPNGPTSAPEGVVAAPTAPGSNVSAPPIGPNPWVDILGSGADLEPTSESTPAAGHGRDGSQASLQPPINDLTLEAKKTTGPSPPPTPEAREARSAGLRLPGAGGPKGAPSARPNAVDPWIAIDQQSSRPVQQSLPRPSQPNAPPDGAAAAGAGPRLKISAPPAAATIPPEKPGTSRIVVALLGAVVIGLAMMAALVYMRPSTMPLEDPLPTDRRPSGDSAAARHPDASMSVTPGGARSWRNLDAGQAPAEPQQIGFVSVMSTPLGAQVELDNVFLGITPIVQRRRLPRTDYILRVTKEGFKPWQKVVQPDDNGGLNVTAVLVEQPQ